MALPQQPILSELKYFVNAFPNGYRPNMPRDAAAQLIKSSLNLLESLPATREFIFEFFSIVFDTSMGNYINFIEKEPQGTAPEDENINDIQEALENLITKGPSAWAPLISSWSLRNLGTLSNKYSRGRLMDIGSSCTLWLGSNAMTCLLGLAATCFSKLNSTDTEECISTLLSTFVQNSPHFDWVVARLGGCFPLKVISKILQCGLKGFVGNFNSTLDSEVGILGYLSFAHDSDLKFAFKEMFQMALYHNVSISQPHVNTIPYLLHLCSMSEIILQPILSVFLEMFNESIISTLVIQSKNWPANFNGRDILSSLSTLVMKIKQDATKAVLTLTRIADKYVWCQEFLETIMQELEMIIWEDRSCPFLCDLTKIESKEMLWRTCNSNNIFDQQTAIRLLLIASSQIPYIYHQTVAKLLENSYQVNNYGFGALLRILAGPLGTPESNSYKPGIELTLESMLIRKLNKPLDNGSRDLNIFNNLLILIKLEKEGSCVHLKLQPITTTLRELTSKFLKIFDAILILGINMIEIKDNAVKKPQKTRIESLSKKVKTIVTDESDDLNKSIQLTNDQIHVVAKVFDALEVGGIDCILNMTDIIKFSQLTVKYFFWTLTENNSIVRTQAINRVYSMLTRQCTARKSSRTIALRELFEGVLFLYGHFLEMPLYETMSTSGKLQTEDLLMSLNQKQGNSLFITRSITHAGIIGNGLKVQQQPNDTSNNEELQNAFIGAITACCGSEDVSTTIDGFSTVSLLLVEMVSSDVMYNGLPWPDEEVFTKVTMERDLQIRRKFKNSPILWAILGLVACYRPALCFASVLLRALCASVLHQWRAKSVDKYQTINDQDEVFEVTKKMLEILSLGQLLPPPLNNLHIVIKYLDPPEMVIVLKDCVWNYLKENVPSPVLYHVDVTGLHWRDSVLAKPHSKFVDPLRMIMQRKLSKVGALYYQMFVLPEELNESITTKDI